MIIMLKTHGQYIGLRGEKDMNRFARELVDSQFVLNSELLSLSV
jgi:hypothetical protein